jgi:hypothetical protein
MKKLREMVEIDHSIRKKSNVNLKQPLNSFEIKDKEFEVNGIEQILLDELNIKSISYSQKEYKLDLTITPELKEEADTRELIRRIQSTRKEMKVNLDQKVIVTNDWYPKTNELVELLKNKTLAVELKLGEFSVNEA